MLEGHSKMDTPEKLTTGRRKTKQKHNTISGRHHYAQTNTNDVNKTWLVLLFTAFPPFSIDVLIFVSCKVLEWDKQLYDIDIGDSNGLLPWYLVGANQKHTVSIDKNNIY